MLQFNDFGFREVDSLKSVRSAKEKMNNWKNLRTNKGVKKVIKELLLPAIKNKEFTTQEEFQEKVLSFCQSTLKVVYPKLYEQHPSIMTSKYDGYREEMIKFSSSQDCAKLFQKKYLSLQDLTPVQKQPLATEWKAYYFRGDVLKNEDTRRKADDFVQQMLKAHTTDGKPRAGQHEVYVLMSLQIKETIRKASLVQDVSKIIYRCNTIRMSGSLIAN